MNRNYTRAFVISFEALYESLQKCRRGVQWKDSVAHYVLNGIKETVRLKEQLNHGTYTPRPPKRFKIRFPKERDIVSVTFRDRIVQRSLNDNVIYPIMTKSFIFDNWACQKGKGTDNARDRLILFLHQFYRKHGRHGYVAQFDIHGYYPNMRHDVVETIFRDALPADIYHMAEDVLRGQYEGNIGYNPGSQIIQIAGISVLNRMDHFIKEQLHIHWYLRYMDDFILIHPDQSYLRNCKERIAEMLETLGFELNESKTRIYPISDGIPFLGFIFRMTETGKVLMLLRPENVKAKRKNLRRLVAKSKRGEIPRASVDKSYEAWRSHASKGNTWGLVKRMDQYYQNLWKDDAHV